MSQEHDANCELFDGGIRCDCKANNPLMVADEQGIRPMLPIIPIAKLHEEWRKAQLDVMSSADDVEDWWINKMQEIIGSNEEEI